MKDIPSDTRELIDLFDRFGPRYARAVSASLHDAGTTPSRLRLLGVLSREGPLPMTALADALCIAPRSVTTLVDGLESDGMVARKAHPTDRRTKVIAPTESGRSAYDASRGEGLRRLARLFEALDPDQRRAMIEGHRALMTAMEYDDPTSGD